MEINILDKYCRICFMEVDIETELMDLESFLPIIKLITNSKFINNPNCPRKICNRCANGLVMASIFRVKVIESNALCRDFIASIWESIEICNKPERSKPCATVEKTCTKIVPEEEVIEVNNDSDSDVVSEACIFNDKEDELKPQDVKISSKNLNVKDVWFEILPENVKVDKVMPVSEASIQHKNQKKKSSAEILKSITQGLTKIKEINIGDNVTIKKVPPKIKDVSIQKTNVCYLRKVPVKAFSAAKKPLIPTRSKMKDSKDLIQLLDNELKQFQNKGNQCFPKFKRKILKMRSKIKYKRPNPDSFVPEDYQCHFSDFYESESDYEMPPVQWDEPLNKGIELPKMNCSKCHASFVSNHQLEVHEEVVHNTNGRTCNLCQRVFKTSGNIRGHKYAVHFSNISTGLYTRHICEICGLLTKGVENHRGTHFEERPYVCDQCGFSTKTKYLLQLHIRTHTGDKRYTCEYCEKKFTYSSDHRRHLMMHTGKYAYTCLTCGKGFVKKNFLRTHQRTHDSQYATLDAI